MNNREFDRSVCFQFYESYLEQAELIKDQLGHEMCAEYFIALVRYGLYKENPTCPTIKMLISGLKNTIDAGQLKRERGFSGENKELTKNIIKYKEENPNATQREIAGSYGCSVGKVNKVLNSNINNNDNTNSNSVNMNMSNKIKRTIKDLTSKEAREIIEKIKRREKYVDIQQEYNLEYGSITKEFEKTFNILQQEQYKDDFENNKDKYEQLATYWGGTAWEVMIKYKTTILNEFLLDDILFLLKNKPIYRPEEWREKYGNDYYFNDNGIKIMNHPYDEYLSKGLKAL